MSLVLECEWCHGKFKAQRKSAKFCSDVCRVSSHRYDPVVIRQEHIDAINMHLKRLVELADRNPAMIVEIDVSLRDLSNKIFNITTGGWNKRVIDEENKRLL